MAGSAWFAYGSVFLLQGKLLWGIWHYRDLSSGDTAAYFISASGWAASGIANLSEYPLYTVPWGSIQWLISDPYAATITDRILIALAASLMVLAVLRRLLSPGIAWALAVWWTVLPINYDNLYEVHLYSLAVELVAVLVACAWAGRRMRAAVFGLLLLDTVFLRTETVIALAVWTAAWVAYEVRLTRRGEGRPRGALLKAFGTPVLAVTLIAIAALASDPNRDAVPGEFLHKNRVNTCQAYAFGYEQRNHDYFRSPFAGCGALSERKFGTQSPTLTEALVANPGAMAGHFIWNLRLAPYGLELLLFDGISGGPNRNPDYVEVHYQSNITAAALLAVTAFAAGGLFLLWRDRRRWWEGWIRERAWGWLALISLGVMAATVLVWQRPRPSYLFALSVLILATIGMSAMVYADRWPRLKLLRAATPLLALLLLIFVPRHYGPDYRTPLIGRPGRPLKEMVDRLYPVRDSLRGNREHLLATYSGPGCPYIGGERPCKPINWKPILNRAPRVTIPEALSERRVDFIYADRMDFEDPPIQHVLRKAEASGWRRVPLGSTEPSWILFERPAGPPVHAS